MCEVIIRLSDELDNLKSSDTDLSEVTVYLSQEYFDKIKNSDQVNCYEKKVFGIPFEVKSDLGNISMPLIRNTYFAII